MEPFDNEQIVLSPQERVFGLEELLTLILELATPNRKKHDLLAYREVGPLWAKCAFKMFKKPPLKFKLCLDDMLALRKITHVQTYIPMEVTVEKWLTKRMLAFLREFASNIVILHIVGVEGAECTVPDAPFLPKLKTLTVDRQSNVFYRESQLLEFVKMIANRAPKLEVFRVILDGIKIKMLKELKKSLKGDTLPEMMNYLETKYANARTLEETLKKNDLRKLKYAKLDFDSSVNSRTISRILVQRLAHLKKLDLSFFGSNEDFYWVHPMPHLEEFISDKAIITSEPGATLSTYFPKLVKLQLTGLDFISLATFTRAGSNYKHLKHLGLCHNLVIGDGGIPIESESAILRKQLVLARITQRGFRAAPNLVSLSFTGFPSSVVDAMVPELFANSKYLYKLTIKAHDLERLCDYLLHAENNPLRGTNFNRVTKLSILPAFSVERKITDCSDLINGPVSIIMPELKTLKLHHGTSVDLTTRNAWKVTGRYISDN